MDKERGVFYGLGVGPGDPELLTLKAHRIIQSADVIISPTKQMGKPSIAYRIIEEYIQPETECRTMNFPMISLSKEREALKKQWQENADVIQGDLDAGRDVVFLTLGDPMVFSTYSYVMEYLIARGVEVVTVSGVPAFCNLAAQINVPLTQGEESLGVVAMTQPMEEIRAILDAHRNIVVMKVSAGAAALADELKARGLEQSFALVSNIGMETQTIVRDLDALYQKVPYLSTVLIKKDYPWS